MSYPRWQPMTDEQKAEVRAMHVRIDDAVSRLDPETEAWLPEELRGVMLVGMDEADPLLTINRLGLPSDYSQSWWTLPCGPSRWESAGEVED